MKAPKSPMVTTIRRSLLAVVASVAVHVGVVLGVVGISAWRMFSMAPPIRVQTIAVDLVKDLPLGAPAAKEPVKAAEPPLPVHKPRHRPSSSKDGVAVVVHPDAGAPEQKPDAKPTKEKRDVGSPDGGSIDGGRRRPGDLRSNGPEGSRVIALLHLDRLRAAPEAEKTTAALDQLLSLLPDRKRLIDGTGFELYRDFDSLLIATPNPVDPSVTFLATRHHLGDAALKAGLDRAAKATQKSIRWQSLDGRPVGIRQQTKADPKAPYERDDRILALPDANMAIVATPAYATQLLGHDPSGKPSYADAGASDGDSNPDGGIKRPRVHWNEIVERIDAEDTAVPEDAAFMMSASNVFGPSVPAAGLIVPGTRGASDDSPPQQVAAKNAAPPDVLTLVVGAQTPYIQVIAEFKTEADAERWEEDLPAWRRQLLTNPIVLISGFSALIRRAQISRDGSNLELRVDATVDEIQRLLNVAVNLTRTAAAARR
jgi:hypothetical protein